MIRLANGFDFTPTTELASKVLVRKAIAAKAVIAAAEKALEATGGAGMFRKLGLERLLRDAHGAQFHPMPETRSEERRVGKECGNTCRYRWSPEHSTTKSGISSWKRADSRDDKAAAKQKQKGRTT